MVSRERFDVFERSGDIVSAIPKCVYITTRAGDKVNVETDILGKYVVGMLGARKHNGVTMETLINAGF